jgi:hypothetical protein
MCKFIVSVHVVNSSIVDAVVLMTYFAVVSYHCVALAGAALGARLTRVVSFVRSLFNMYILHIVNSTTPSSHNDALKLNCVCICSAVCLISASLRSAGFYTHVLIERNLSPCCMLFCT